MGSAVAWSTCSLWLRQRKRDREGATFLASGKSPISVRASQVRCHVKMIQVVGSAHRLVARLQAGKQLQQVITCGAGAKRGV